MVLRIWGNWKMISENLENVKSKIWKGDLGKNKIEFWKMSLNNLKVEKSLDENL